MKAVYVTLFQGFESPASVHCHEHHSKRRDIAIRTKTRKSICRKCHNIVFAKYTLDIDVTSSVIIVLVMNMEELKTINEVCKMLDMTSRTIRYYEQLQLITTVRESKTAPRRLDAENIERLRKIRFLRKLGLTLDEITEVIDSDKKATELIIRKKAAMKAEINELVERVNLLTEVMAAAEQGENIYATEKRLSFPPDHEEMKRIAGECTKLIMERRFEELQGYLDEDMRQMPPGFFEVGWNVHIKPCGEFVSIGEQNIVADTVINRLHFEKQDVAICIEVHAGIVTGMFLQYCKE